MIDDLSGLNLMQRQSNIPGFIVFIHIEDLVQSEQGRISFNLTH